MNFQFNPNEQTLRNEVREFLQQELTSDVLEEFNADLGLGPHTRRFMCKMGEKRLLAPSYPVEFGGRAASPMERFVILEELAYALGPGYTAPRILYGVNIVGPTLLLYGTPEQKRRFLPRLASGEIEFAIGYTEPEAGSDLASLQTRAVEDKDCWIINGQKLFNTGCHYAEYHWLAARTDFTAPKHKGISLFTVDLKSPGIGVDPIWILGGGRTNAVYYEDVRVPKDCLVGEKNQGWVYITKALDFERIWVTGGTRRALDDLVKYCRTTKLGEQTLIENCLVRQKIAQLSIEVEVSYLLGVRLSWMLNKGIVPNYEASMSKAFGGELEQRLAKTGMEIQGLYSQLQEGSKFAPMNGLFEHQYRNTIRTTIGGGTSEIQRTIIAVRGLGLPRA